MMTAEEKKAYFKAYREKRKEHYKAYFKARRQKHKEGLQAYQKQYRIKHKEELQEKGRQHYLANREEIQARNACWLESNKERYGTWRKQYYAEKRKNDPKFRINKAMGRSVWGALKGKKGGRKWLSLLGYTTEELMTHLEKQFQEGMTWENYGLWEIDHRVPVCSFNFISAEDSEFKNCWALGNLRPLWAEENLNKSASDRQLSVRKKNL